MRKPIAKKSLQLTGLYESELLTELLLRFWKHPLADDADFRLGLLESAAEVLRSSIDGEQLLEDMPPSEMNLVAAIWTAEWRSVSLDPEITNEERLTRIEWLTTIRRAIPSCFCKHSLLDDSVDEE